MTKGKTVECENGVRNRVRFVKERKVRPKLRIIFYFYVKFTEKRNLEPKGDIKIYSARGEGKVSLPELARRRDQ